MWNFGNAFRQTYTPQMNTEYVAPTSGMARDTRPVQTQADSFLTGAFAKGRVPSTVDIRPPANDGPGAPALPVPSTPTAPQPVPQSPTVPSGQFTNWVRDQIERWSGPAATTQRWGASAPLTQSSTVPAGQTIAEMLRRQAIERQQRADFAHHRDAYNRQWYDAWAQYQQMLQPGYRPNWNPVY